MFYLCDKTRKVPDKKADVNSVQLKHVEYCKFLGVYLDKIKLE